jgi:hypothetical protein
MQEYGLREISRGVNVASQLRRKIVYEAIT